jgi:hypothetical protein
MSVNVPVASLQGKGRGYPLDKGMGGSQSKYGQHGEGKVLDLIGTVYNSDPSVIQLVAADLKHHLDLVL